MYGMEQTGHSSNTTYCCLDVGWLPRGNDIGGRIHLPKFLERTACVLCLDKWAVRAARFGPIILGLGASATGTRVYPIDDPADLRPPDSGLPSTFTAAAARAIIERRRHDAATMAGSFHRVNIGGLAVQPGGDFHF